MKARLAVALILIATMANLSVGQQGVKARAVSLSEVLSCADQPFFSRIFNLTVETVYKLMPERKEYDSQLVAFYGFRILPPLAPGATNSGADLTIIALPQGGTFCQFYPTIGAMAVPVGDTIPHPITIVIDPGDRWTVDPNEVFAHADQFRFESGTFESSTDVYLLATRGNTTIRFRFDQKSKGLKFSRVIYDNPKGFKDTARDQPQGIP